MKTRVNNPAATEGTAQYYAEYLTQHADKENRYIVRGENTLGYITGTQKPGQSPVCFVVLAVNVEAGGDPTLIDRETIATDYRPATKEDEDVFKVRIF